MMAYKRANQRCWPNQCQQVLMYFRCIIGWHSRLLIKKEHLTSARASLQWLPINACVDYKVLLATCEALHNMAYQYIISLQAFHILCLQDAEIIPAFNTNSLGSGSSFMGPVASQTSNKPLCGQHTQFQDLCPVEVHFHCNLSVLLNGKDNLATATDLMNKTYSSFCWHHRLLPPLKTPKWGPVYHVTLHSHVNSTMTQAALWFEIWLLVVGGQRKINRNIFSHDKTWKKVLTVRNIYSVLSFSRHSIFWT